jgi:DNA-binding NarL/FixJ family response regulator
MLSGSSRDEDVFAALQAGAVGYLLKDTDPDRLPLAVEGALDGEAAMPRTLVARLINEFQSREHRSRRRLGTDGVELSEREWAVLNGLADGLSTKELAVQLGVSPVTVRRHVSGVLEKLEVPTRDEAVRLLDASRS